MRRRLTDRLTKVEPRVPGGNTKHHAEFANLQWDDVRLFRAVLWLGSMRKVASDPGVVVDTIRRRIERIEARLGLTLVQRSGNGIMLAED